MNAYDQSGGYLDWYSNEDTYLWYRMSKNDWKLKYVDQITVDVGFNINSVLRRRGVRYFMSEIALRKLMYANGDITLSVLCTNIILRVTLQILLPVPLYKEVFKWTRK